MEIERAYDFNGTHLPLFLGFAGHVTKQVVSKRQRVAPFGPGLALAEPLVVPFPLEGDEHVADIEIGVAQGRPACLAVRSAHGQPLTGVLLRSLPLARVVTEAAARNTYRVFRARRGRYIGVYYSDAFEGMLGFEDDLEELRGEVKDKRRTLDHDFRAQIAAVYRDAMARAYPPAKAVQELLGPTSPENARRWIALARDGGELGKAPGRGRHGEQATTRRGNDG